MISCGITEVQFVNNSYQRQYIKSQKWEFPIGNTKVSSTDWEPKLKFPGIGKYNGKLWLNPGTGCADSADIEVRIFPDLTADFSYKYDTCYAQPVQFTDLSVSGSGGIVSYDWAFGDGQKGAGKLINHPYNIPGEFSVALTVKDLNQCVETVTKKVRYFPVPGILVVKPSQVIACAPANLIFDNLSKPVDDTYKVSWDFGDGTNSTLANPGKIYSTPGTYTVSLIVTSCDGCSDTIVKQDYIRIQGPNGSFRVDPSVICLGSGITTYTSATNTATLNYLNGEGTSIPISYFPIIPEGDTVLDTISYVYNDTGIYYPQMLLTDTSGCSIAIDPRIPVTVDRKSTRLNSSH